MATVKREKILHEAEKLAARGKLEAAIREYQRALEQAPTDANTLNRLGDLLVRVNRIPEAIEVYERIAEHFAEDGFFLKSIAIYKKINRLDPQRIAVYERLADLYFKQGLAVEGRQQLLTLADWFLRAKRQEDAVRVFRKLAELEPGNLQTRAKLVDLLVQIGDAEAASEEIDALGQALLSRKLLDEAVKLYQRALELHPDDADMVVPCVQALIEARRGAQALELGSRALESAGGGAELRVLLARVMLDADDTAGARAAVDALPEALRSRADVGQLLGEILLCGGEVVEAKRHIIPAVDRFTAAGESRRALPILRRLQRSAPADIDVLERLAKAVDRIGETEEATAVEAALSDAYFDAGRSEDAVALYRKLVHRDPSNRHAVQRLEELGVSVAPPTAAPGPAAGEVELSFAVDDAGLGGELEFVEMDIPDAPGEGEGEPAATTRAQAFGAGPSGVVDDVNVEELYTEAMVFAKYGLADKAVAHLERLLESAPSHEKARELLESLTAGAATSTAFELVPAMPAGDETGAGPDGADAMGMTHHIGPAEMESVLRVGGFEGLADGGAEEAPEVEPPGEGGEPAALAPSGDGEPLSWSPAPQDMDAAVPFEAPIEFDDAVEVVAGAVEEVDVAEALAGPAEESLAEIDFFLEQGLLDEAAESLETLRQTAPDHPEVVARQALLKSRGWEEAAPPAGAEGDSAEALFSEEEQFFDLAAELEKELAEEELVAEAAGPQQGEEVSIEELFKEFQRGVAEQVGDDDFDTHFNLGLAYREMSLLDEAIGEFQLAAKSEALFVECATMIGACYLDKGLPEQAVEWYSRALHAPALPPDSELGLRYELGRTLEAAGNRDAALAQFAEVLAINPAFRDVVERVSKLQSN